MIPTRLSHNAHSPACAIALAALFASGCQAGYLIKSAAAQVSILSRRVPIADALADPHLSAEQKRKLELARDARAFAESELGLKKTHNYESFVQLDRPYVSYVVHAAPKNELKPYLWSYPIVGEMPYRGYSKPEDANEEAARMRADGFDVYVRGVSAYSTLGWFRDPVLSSMLAYKDWDLVNTIIHETTHATLFIRSESSFNERLATFVGDKGTNAYYAKREGVQSKALAAIARESAAERVFSEFISRELSSLETWYESRKPAPIVESVRQARIKQIQIKFRAEARPEIPADFYAGFETAEMNNARLLAYRLYVEDLSDFEAAYAAMNNDMPRFIAFCKTLEKAADPAAQLKAAGRITVSR